MKILFLLFIDNKNQHNHNALIHKIVAAQCIAPLQFVNYQLSIIINTLQPVERFANVRMDKMKS